MNNGREPRGSNKEYSGVETGNSIFVYRGGKWETLPLSTPAEETIRIIVNGKRLTALMCTPEKLESLAVGFIYTSGIISYPDDISSVKYDETAGEVRIALKRLFKSLPRTDSAIKTPGFGSGVIFSERVQGQKPPRELKICPERLISLMEDMKGRAALYKKSGGIHASAVSDGVEILSIAEDIGRHNTLDKVIGECFIKGIPLLGSIMLTTGRISSEMVLKSVRLGLSAIASLSSPTAKAVSLAEEMEIGLAGYVSIGGFNAYAKPETFKS